MNLVWFEFGSGRPHFCPNHHQPFSQGFSLFSRVKDKSHLWGLLKTHTPRHSSGLKSSPFCRKTTALCSGLSRCSPSLLSLRPRCHHLLQLQPETTRWNCWNYIQCGERFMSHEYSRYLKMIVCNPRLCMLFWRTGAHACKDGAGVTCNPPADQS